MQAPTATGTGKLRLERIRAVLEDVPYVSTAILFGSRAKGTARFDSDFDIAVLPDAPLSTEQRYELIRTLSEVAGSPIDLIDLAAEHGFVAGEALLRGKLLFCKKPQSYQARLRRLVYDAEDFLPALRQGQREALARWIKTSPAAS